MYQPTNRKCLWPEREPSQIDELVELVDTEAPHFQYTARLLRDMVSAGVDMTPESVAIAEKLGFMQHATEDPLWLPDEARRASTSGDIVYYVRRSHLVKIGTTRRLRTRMSHLMPDEILAIEPGGRLLEGERLKQFSRDRARVANEYFYPSESLVQHMIKVRKRHGAPPEDLPSISTDSPLWGRAVRQTFSS